MISGRIKQLEEFLKEEPGDAFTMYALALEFVKAGNTEKASTIFSELLNKHPGYLPAYYHYGKLIESLDEIELANGIFRKGMELAMQKNDLKTYNELKSALDTYEED